MNHDLEQQGYQIVPQALAAGDITELSDAIAPLLNSVPFAGIRNLVEKMPPILQLAESDRMRGLIEPSLGPCARLVRSVLFNKTSAANWQVAWHQDVGIAVQRRIDGIDGYDTWSRKDGVDHVLAPPEVLENMLTVRLHLDDADETNGALWVSPGTHRLGRLADHAIEAALAKHGKQLCTVAAGDALLLRPLLLHASRKATQVAARRVIHLEFAGIDLPAPLAWSEFA